MKNYSSEVVSRSVIDEMNIAQSQLLDEQSAAIQELSDEVSDMASAVRSMRRVTISLIVMQTVVVVMLLVSKLNLFS